MKIKSNVVGLITICAFTLGTGAVTDIYESSNKQPSPVIEQVQVNKPDPTQIDLIIKCRKAENLCFKSSGDPNKDEEYGVSHVKQILHEMDLVYGRSNTPYDYIPVEPQYWNDVAQSIKERNALIESARESTR